MVTSAIFAPNSVLIMNYLYSLNDSSTSCIDKNRIRLIGSSATSNGLMSMNGSTYVMITADSKGQLKLLVNRYHR